MEDETKGLSLEDWLNDDEGINHQRNDGKWCKIFREALGVKQVVIATDLKISQQAIAKAEKKTHLPNQVLEVYANHLQIPVDLIKKMPDIEKVTNIFYDQSQLVTTQNISNITFNPLDELNKVYQQYVADQKTVISDQKEMISDQKKMLKNMQEMQEKTNNILELLAEKLAK